MKKIFYALCDFISKYNIAICMFGIYALITRALGLQNCLCKLLIGYPCPGCGMTRAGLAVLCFDFSAAFRYNPLIFVLPVILVIVILKDFGIAKKLYHSKWLWVIMIGIVLLVYILRFIFIYPDIPMDYYENNLIAWIISLFQ